MEIDELEEIIDGKNVIEDDYKIISDIFIKHIYIIKKKSPNLVTLKSIQNYMNDYIKKMK